MPKAKSVFGSHAPDCPHYVPRKTKNRSPLRDISGTFSGFWDEGVTVIKNPHAVALGRKGGKATKGKTSPAKARAARKNGKKGGRPRTKNHVAAP